MLAKDPTRITHYSPFLADINLVKLKKKNIDLSPSIVYKRPVTRLLIGGKSLRKIDKNEARARSFMR